MENLSFKLIVTAYRKGILTCLIENGTPVQLDYNDGSSVVGSIYAGRVRSVSKNLEAVFVDIGTPLPGFLPLSGGRLPRFLDGQEHRTVREGDEILVKVRKDAHKTKGPSLVDRFPEEKDEAFVRKASFVRAPALVQEDKPFWAFLAERTAAGHPGCLEIITDQRDVFRALTGSEPPVVEEYAKKLPEAFRKPEKVLKMQGADVPVRYHDGISLPLTAVYSLETAVSEALSRKVWLKSGGYLVIEQTEALTVIDVNSGKNEKKIPREEMILQTDEEAVSEAMRQIRLRNLSGIILIDLIDLKTKETQASLLNRMKYLASLDPAGTQAVDITKLNLAEIVRKKSGRPFADQLRSSGGSGKED